MRDHAGLPAARSKPHVFAPPPRRLSTASSSASPSITESPSPPSSDSNPDFDFHPSVPHSQPLPPSALSTRHTLSRPPSRRTRLALSRPSILPMSSYQSSLTSIPNQQRTSSALALADSRFVPVHTDESTTLIPYNHTSASVESELHESRADLDRIRWVDSHPVVEPDSGLRDRYIIGGTVFTVFSIVFVIIISGMTTLLANRNFPQLEIFSDFEHGGQIPLKYGCHAEDGNPISIPLRWQNIPRSASNLVVLFANPGAMLHKGYDPVHWFVTDIPLHEEDYSLVPNASTNPQLLPPGAKQRANLHSKQGLYWPPCAHNGTSLFVIHAYAIEASPIITSFRDAREVMNRFVGVPVARLAGYYGDVPPNRQHHTPRTGLRDNAQPHATGHGSSTGKHRRGKMQHHYDRSFGHGLYYHVPGEDKGHDSVSNTALS